jgi:hypothetical protein
MGVCVFVRACTHAWSAVKTSVMGEKDTMVEADCAVPLRWLYPLLGSGCELQCCPNGALGWSWVLLFKIFLAMLG